MVWVRIKHILAWVAGIVGAAIAGLITNYVWALVDPNSKPADIVRDHYPPALAKLVRPARVDAPPEIAETPRPVPKPAESSAQAKAELPQGDALITTPTSAPLSARVLTPLKSDEKNVRVTLLLTSRIDAQKVFVPQNGRLVDWSARIVESGAVCWTGYGEITGIKSLYGDKWREAGVDLDQLPSSIASQVDTTFICDKPVSVGETLLFKARFDTVTGTEKSPVTFTSSALRIAERR